LIADQANKLICMQTIGKKIYLCFLSANRKLQIQRCRKMKLGSFHLPWISPLPKVSKVCWLKCAFTNYHGNELYIKLFYWAIIICNQKFLIVSHHKSIFSVDWRYSQIQTIFLHDFRAGTNVQIHAAEFVPLWYIQFVRLALTLAKKLDSFAN